MMKVLQLVGIFAANADFSWGRPSACGGLSGRLFWLRLRCSVGQLGNPQVDCQSAFPPRRTAMWDRPPAGVPSLPGGVASRTLRCR